MDILWERIKATFTEFQWWNVLLIIGFCVLAYALLAFLRRNKIMPLLKYLLIGTFALGIVVALGTTMIPESWVSALIVTLIGLSYIFVFCILFKNEVRRSLFKLASPRKEADHYFSHYECSDEELQACISEMVRGCISLAKSNTGALILLEHDNMPQYILDSGTRLGAVCTAPLLECLFNTKAPLHDGAVVVDGNRIVAAGCFLPLSQNNSLPKELGTRHRAGIGITEAVDVLSIIVSEETGVISIVKNGVITRYYDANMLTQAMEQFYGLKAVQTTRRKRR